MLHLRRTGIHVVGERFSEVPRLELRELTQLPRREDPQTMPLQRVLISVES